MPWLICSGRSPRNEPVAITLDDIQWIDEASCSLLHYVARHVDAASGLLIVCAARDGEIEDNAAASSVLRSLSREQRLRKIELGPLGPEETEELVRSLDPALDGARIFAGERRQPAVHAGACPRPSPGDAEPGPTIERVIAGQLARADGSGARGAPLGGGHGRAFTPDDLARARPARRRGSARWLSANWSGADCTAGGDDAYDFAHDLVRQTAYRTVSQPRRKLLHRHIARALHSASKARSRTRRRISPIMRALADDYESAAQACVIAGDRALRLFANVEAAEFRRAGLASHRAAG